MSLTLAPSGTSTTKSGLFSALMYETFLANFLENKSFVEHVQCPK